MRFFCSPYIVRQFESQGNPCSDIVYHVSQPHTFGKRNSENSRTLAASYGFWRLCPRVSSVGRHATKQQTSRTPTVAASKKNRKKKKKSSPKSAALGPRSRENDVPKLLERILLAMEIESSGVHLRDDVSAARGSSRSYGGAPSQCKGQFLDPIACEGTLPETDYIIWKNAEPKAIRGA